MLLNFIQLAITIGTYFVYVLVSNQCFRMWRNAAKRKLQAVQPKR